MKKNDPIIIVTQQKEEEYVNHFFMPTYFSDLIQLYKIVLAWSEQVRRTNNRYVPVFIYAYVL